MTYEVYIDVHHHPKHWGDEKRDRTAFKLTDDLGTGEEKTENQKVAHALRAFADEIEARDTASS